MKTRYLFNINILIVSLIFIVSLPALGEKEQDEKEPIVPDYSSIVVIKSKTHESILTSKGLFYISKYTKVYDQEGSEVKGDIAGLPVPCRAQIFHEKVEIGDPTAVKIVIIQVYPNATTAFARPLPE